MNQNDQKTSSPSKTIWGTIATNHRTKYDDGSTTWQPGTTKVTASKDLNANTKTFFSKWPGLLGSSKWRTPTHIVEKVVSICHLQPGDVFFDLGCGDGRLLIAVAQAFNIKCVGYDIDEDVVAEALQNVNEAGLSHLIHVC